MERCLHQAVFIACSTSRVNNAHNSMESLLANCSHDAACNAQYRAREWVSTNLDCNSSRRISLFETNIRIVGGLLSAYELSQDHMFLDKAQDCVDLMLPIFQTAPTGENHVAVFSPSSPRAS